MKERCIQKLNLGLSHVFVVQSFSHVRLFVAPLTTAWTPFASPSPGVCSNSCPLSWWCHPTNWSSVGPFASCLQSFPASGSFPMSQLFAWAGQSIEASPSSSVLPMNSQDWFPLELTALISLQPKGLSRVFSNTTAQKQQFFGAQPSSSFLRNSRWLQLTTACLFCIIMRRGYCPNQVKNWTKRTLKPNASWKLTAEESKQLQQIFGCTACLPQGSCLTSQVTVRNQRLTGTWGSRTQSRTNEHGKDIKAFL